MANKKFLLGLGLAMILGGVTGCNTNKGPVEPQEAQYTIYKLAVEAGFEGTYEEWLESVKGPQGDKGDQGEDGEDGQDGKDGNSVLNGTVAPTAEDGKDGDIYFDTATGDVYVKAEGAWTKVGNVKGADGQDGADGEDGQDGQDGEDGEDGEDGVGIADISVKEETRGDAVYTIYTFKMTDGSVIVKEVMKSHKHKNSTYRVDSINEEKHVVLAANTPCDYCDDYDTYVTDTVAKGQVDITGADFGGASEIIHVWASSTYPVAWDAEKNAYVNGNYHVGSSTSSITFNPLVDGVLTFDIVCAGESTYDFTSSGATNGAVDSTGTAFTTRGNASGTDFSYSRTITMPADSSYTLSYQKDSNGDKGRDGFELSNVKFTSAAISVSKDDFAAVSFNSMNGSFVAPKAVKKGGMIADLATPTKEGYAFGGWYTNIAYTNAFDPATMAITKDTTLYAKWVDVVYGVTTVLGVETMYDLAKGMPWNIADPVAEGYKFGGWYTTPEFTEGTEFASGTVVDANIAIYAKMQLLNTKATPDYVSALNYTGRVTTNADEYDYYVLFTAPATERYYFSVKSSIDTADFAADSPKKSSGYHCIWLLNADGSDITNPQNTAKTLTKVTNSFSEKVNSASYTDKYYGSQYLARADLQEGEQIMVGMTASYYASYVTYATLNWSVTTLANDTPDAAIALTLGTNYEVEFPFRGDSNIGSMYKFTATATRHSINAISTGNSPYVSTRVLEIGQDEVSGATTYTEKASPTFSGTTASSSVIEGLTVGKEYLVTVGCNRSLITDQGTFTFSIGDAPKGYSDDPIVGGLTVGAEPINVTRIGKPTTFYKVHLDNDGAYAVNYNGGFQYSKKLLTVYDLEGTVVKAKQSITATSGASEIMLTDMTAGDYVFEVGYDSSSSTGTTSGYIFTVAITFIAPGSHYSSALDAEFVSDVATLTPNANGVFYKFCVADATKLNKYALSSDEAFTATFYKADGATVVGTTDGTSTVNIEADSATQVFYVKVVGSADIEMTFTLDVLPPNGKTIARAFVFEEEGLMDVTSYLTSSSQSGMYFKATAAVAGKYRIYSRSVTEADPAFGSAYINGSSSAATITKPYNSSADDVAGYSGSVPQAITEYCNYKYDFYVNIELEAGDEIVFSCKLPATSSKVTSVGIGFSLEQATVAETFDITTLNGDWVAHFDDMNFSSGDDLTITLNAYKDASENWKYYVSGSTENNNSFYSNNLKTFTWVDNDTTVVITFTFEGASDDLNFTMTYTKATEVMTVTCDGDLDPNGMEVYCQDVVFTKVED